MLGLLCKLICQALSGPIHRANFEPSFKPLIPFAPFTWSDTNPLQTPEVWKPWSEHDDPLASALRYTHRLAFGLSVP